MSDGTFAINKDKGTPLKAVENNDGTCTLTVTGTSFSPPANSDSGTVEYPDTVTEIYKFREGGITGTILRTLTLVYVDASKARLSSWSAN